MLALQIAPGLTEQQMNFVVGLRTMPAQDAAAVAGYKGERAHLYLLSLPQVLAAVHVDVQRNLQSDVWQNLRVLRKIRDDDAAPARVRADIAVKLTNLAGHITPSTKDKGQQKAISEMSQAELLEHIERNQAAVERAELELANKAKDITPADSVPHNVPTAGPGAAKSMEYLD